MARSWLRGVFARKQGTIRRPVGLRVEEFETRLVPATAALQNGVLSILGTDGADAIDVRYRSDTNSVEVVGGGAVVGLFAAGSVSRVEFSGLGGNDTFSAAGLTAIPVTADGGAGDDVLEGGPGNDTLIGGPGNDTYRFNTSTPIGADIVSEQFDAGEDTLDFTGSSQGVNVNLNNANLTGRSDGRVGDSLSLRLASGWLEHVVGGSGNDTIVGTGWHNKLTGGPGDDILEGQGGNDTLDGGTGNDRYRFNASSPLGTDVIREEFDAGEDTLDFTGTSPGVNVNLNNANLTSRTDGRVNDNLSLSLQSGWLEHVVGGSGDDTIVGTGWHNMLDGGPGNDRIYGLKGNDTIIGGDGDDFLFGREGDDALFGGNGRNSLDPGDGDDLVFGLNKFRPTAAELARSGRLAASLRDLGDGRKALALNGPSGYGFEISGNWQSNGAAAESFAVHGLVTVSTGFGDVSFTIPEAVPLTIATTADSWAGAGVVSKIEGTSSSLMGAAQLGRTIEAVENWSGSDISLPGVTWGIDLGSTLKGQGFSAPVNNAVPYLYFATKSGVSGSFGGITIAASGDFPAVEVVFDPADPYLYLGVDGIPSPSPVKAVGFGVSLQGRIPFQPSQSPQDWTPDSLLGHLYVAGDVDLSSLAKIPVAVNGKAVLDLDANDDGNILGGLPRTPAGLFSGGSLLNGFQTADAQSILADLGIGVNGQTRLTLGKGPISVDLSVFGGTLIYDGSHQSLYGRVATENPLEGIECFEGTPLEMLASAGTWIDFTARADGVARAQIGGVTPTGAAWTLTADNAGVHGNFEFDLGEFASSSTQGIEVFFPVVSIPGINDLSRKILIDNLIGNAKVSGRLNSDGTFSFSGTVEVNLFGTGTKSWRVTVTQDKLVLGDPAAAVDQYARFVYGQAMMVYNEVKVLVGQAYRTVYRFFNDKGVVSRWEQWQNGAINFMASIENGKTLIRTWDATGQHVLKIYDGASNLAALSADNLTATVNSAVSGLLETEKWIYQGSAVVERWMSSSYRTVIQRFQNGAMIGWELYQQGTRTFMATIENGSTLIRTWTDTGHHVLKVYNGVGNLAALNVDSPTSTLGSVVGNLSQVEEWIYEGSTLVRQWIWDPIKDTWNKIVNWFS